MICRYAETVNQKRKDKIYKYDQMDINFNSHDIKHFNC